MVFFIKKDRFIEDIPTSHHVMLCTKKHSINNLLSLFEQLHPFQFKPSKKDAHQSEDKVYATKQEYVFHRAIYSSKVIGKRKAIHIEIGNEEKENFK